MEYYRKGVSDEKISTTGTLKGAHSATIPWMGTDHSAFVMVAPESHQHVMKQCLFLRPHRHRRRDMVAEHAEESHPLIE